MSDADTDATEIESERDEADAGAGGLRQAMEQRVKSLQDAEDRIRREQAALQEQAKVVFAEREARLRRPGEGAGQREAALAVNEGIAGHASATTDRDLQEREQAIAAREAAVAQLAEELEAREQALAAESAAEPSAGSAAERRRVAELEQTVAALEEQLKAAASPDTAHERRDDEREAELKDREHRAKKVEQVLQQKELHVEAARSDLDQREAAAREREAQLAAR